MYNAEQCEGLPERPRDDRPRWGSIDEAERILKHSGAQIRNTGDDRAYYDLANRDRIVLPHRDQFPDAPSYYQTALHELGHWTGHPERLNRETLVRGTEQGFGSALYAREELRAEISSMVTCQRLNLGHDPERHAGYVRTWVRALRDDPREIYRSADEAHRISDYIFERVRERAPEREAGGRHGERVRRAQGPEPSAPGRGEDPRPVAGEQQRLFAAGARAGGAVRSGALGAGGRKNEVQCKAGRHKPRCWRGCWPWGRSSPPTRTPCRIRTRNRPGSSPGTGAAAGRWPRALPGSTPPTAVRRRRRSSR